MAEIFSEFVMALYAIRSVYGWNWSIAPTTVLYSILFACTFFDDIVLSWHFCSDSFGSRLRNKQVALGIEYNRIFFKKRLIFTKFLKKKENR